MGPIAKARAKWRASLPKSKPAPVGPRKVVGGDAAAVSRKRKRTVLFDDDGEENGLEIKKIREDDGLTARVPDTPSSLPPSSSSKSAPDIDIVKEALVVARAARARIQDMKRKEQDKEIKEQEDLFYVARDTWRIKERVDLESIQRFEVHWPEDNSKAMRDFELITGRPLPLRLFN